jgi:uncharacterized protein DUF4304
VTEERKQMERALRDVFVPVLRELGFKGSLPHFRRLRPQQLDLVSFQYFSSGGSFVVEVAKAPPEGITTSWGEFIPPEKANVTWINERLRLGAPPEGGDHWYSFGPRSYDPPAKPRPYEHYVAVANEVAEDMKSQGEQWLRAGR